MGALRGIIAGRRIEGIIAGPIAFRIQTARTNVVRTDIPIITGIGRTYACTRAITGVGMGAAQDIIAGSRIEGIVAGSIAIPVQAARTVVVCADIPIITAVPGTQA